MDVVIIKGLQNRFHDQIIRDNNEFHSIRNYIKNNPAIGKRIRSFLYDYIACTIKTYMKQPSTFFAPMIYLNKVAPAIEFYKKAFDAIELRRWSNDDDSVHVAEMSIDGALFHLHEEVTRINELSPETLKGTTVVIGLFVNDPHAVMAKAVAAGGTEIDPVKDYDYDYRQGRVADPFGHHWLIEKKIG